MRVTVQLPGVRAPLVYEAPDGTGTGDLVTVPPLSTDPDGAGPRHGVVLREGGDWAGPAVAVLSARRQSRTW